MLENGLRAFCVGINLKDAFLHVSINENFQKYLKFEWLGQLYKWIVLPFGLCCSPRVLTKVLKTTIAFLRVTFAMLISIYLDDMLIKNDTALGAYFHGQLTALVLMILGWSLYWEKSNFVPSQQITHLRFEWETSIMLISCTKSKIERLQNVRKSALQSSTISVNECERMLGYMESVRPVTSMQHLDTDLFRNSSFLLRPLGPESEGFQAN